MLEKIKLQFPDGSIKEVEKNKSAEQIISETIGEGLLRAAIAVKINNEVKDITTPITKDCKFKVLTFKDPEGIEVFRHSSAHILAMAVQKLYPNVKLTIGPAIENGFYYDFESHKPFSEEDLLKIETEAKKIIKEKILFEKIDVDYNKAKELSKNEPYKLEMIEELKDQKKKLSYYKLGDWYDLCRGPHVKSTGKIKAFKLTKISGAYWRADANNKQLQRIYGTSFPSKDELKNYLKLLEEAAKRDHRKIGKELDLFSFHEEAPGMPFYHNKGSFIWDKLVEYTTEIMIKRNYEINKTPIILNKSLW